MIRAIFNVICLLLPWCAFGLSVYQARIEPTFLWNIITIMWGVVAVLSTIDAFTPKD